MIYWSIEREFNEMKPSSVRINVAASTKALDVDNRISLRYYFRIADNVLKQVRFILIFLCIVYV